MSGPDAGSPVVERVGQIAIPVTELERAVAFYRDALGLPLLFQAPPALAFLDMGGIRLMLDGSAAEAAKGAAGAAGAAGSAKGSAKGSAAGAAVDSAESGGDEGGVVLYYAVEDLDAAHATLAGRGVVFAREPHLVARMPDHELWMAFFRDPDGHLLALMSEVRA